MLLSIIYFLVFVSIVSGFKFFYQAVKSPMDNKVKDVWIYVRKNSFFYQVSFILCLIVIFIIMTPILVYFEAREIIKTIKNGQN
jgi:hypothetical protein